MTGKNTRTVWKIPFLESESRQLLLAPADANEQGWGEHADGANHAALCEPGDFHSAGGRIGSSVVHIRGVSLLFVGTPSTGRPAASTLCQPEVGP